MRAVNTFTPHDFSPADNAVVYGGFWLNSKKKRQKLEKTPT